MPSGSSSFRKLAFLLVMIILGLAVCGQGRAAGRLSFEAIDAEPLGCVSAGAIVLHDEWSLREEAVAGNDGAQFSTAGFRAEGWYGTTVPTTVLGALVRLGVYPDPYIGNNNDRIPAGRECPGQSLEAAVVVPANL